MKNNETDYIRSYIKNQVNGILLYSAFAADTINPHKKISEIITFPEDVERIRERIKDKFDIYIHQDLSSMSPMQVYTMIFMVVINSEERKAKILNFAKNQVQEEPVQEIAPATAQVHHGKMWNRRSIFSYLIGNLRTAFGRPLQPNEKIRDLINEAYSTGTEPTAFMNKLKELESFFGIKIDQEMRIFNIGDAAEKSLIAQGKAVDSAAEKESMDPLWATIHTALSINFWHSIISRDLGLQISVYKLSRTHSYQEFEALIAEAKQKKDKKKEEPKKFGINYTEQEVQEIVQNAIMQRLFASKKEVVPGAKITDLGANSLDLIDICDNIEKLLNVRFDTTDFAQFGPFTQLTVAGLIKILRDKYGFKPATTAEAVKAYDQSKRDFCGTHRPDAPKSM
ncbi:MAG: hypothetical protein J5613_03165 [Alphaproteobacteria bacterium]|nr:hypothetical protein [Alphaproteobacteria bacterium]